MKKEDFYFGKNIESVFKVKPPFTRSKTKHGFIGVLLRDTLTDELQCHECGKWFKSLSAHVAVAHPKKFKDSKDYKEKFGLPIHFPMVSRRISRLISNSARHPDNLALLKKSRQKHDLKTLNRKFVKVRTFRGKKTEAYLNSKGLCKKQILERYKVVAKIVGRNPTNADLEKYDESLFAALRRRYDNKINVFRIQNGFGIHAEKIYAYDEAAIIAALRLFKFKTGKTPKSGDFRKAKQGVPSIDTIRRHFGSWQRAVASSGI